jgi:hypothetical protein
LTPRPTVPVLVHVAALSLAGSPGCGDDGTGGTNATTTTTNDSVFDDHPTACHNSEPGCDTLPLDSTTGADASSSGTGATGTTGTTGTDGSSTASTGSSGEAGTSSGSGSESGSGSSTTGAG